MLSYIFRRFIYMIVSLLILSIVVFIIIQLPPGDYLTMYRMQLEMRGLTVDDSEIAALERLYGLDLPMHKQYLKWMWGLLRWDLGRSLEWGRPVSELILERLAMTVVVSFSAIVFTYLIAIPIGIYCATHQYSILDYIFTILGFIGLATPGFLLALVIMVCAYKYFGLSVGGLFSPEYESAPWSIAKVVDLLKHIYLPMIILGLAGAAGLIRTMRACLLDELRKQYVTTARAKGLSEKRLLFKYPVRVALNPIASTIGWMLPAIVSGGTIVAIVLNLPTVGPLLYRALMSQDMYLAGDVVLLLAFLTIVGTFLSDLLLAWLDPRIRYEKRT